METSYKEIESVSFSSDLQNIRIAEKLIDDVCRNHEIHEDYYGNILIAVTEAVNNAIQHGNLLDQSKLVNLGIHQHETELRFTVEDQGAGFDFNKLRDPTAPENIEKECGRGIFLMKSLADDVVFENNGTKVILAFDISK